ncbi:MAG: hypothetical protein PWQ32_845, partial [Thermococcaceae archaeon]|nr:hypothetical protein [Thermococcaceae archaeon]
MTSNYISVVQRTIDTVRISCGVSGLSYWQYFRKRRGNMKSETIIYW